MTSDRKPLLLRATEWSLRRLVRVWPLETREWAAAMATEAGEIENPWAALRWLLGGVLFFLRSVASHFLAWMRLPVGANSPLGAGGNRPAGLPRHSRLVTATLLLAAMALLLLPQGREALIAIRSSWSNSEMAASDKRAIEDLAARAIRERDARKLAFAAVSYPEPGKSNAWAEQAVAMDPALRWIYASHATRGMRWEIPESHLQALREFDPHNAFVYLLSADRIYRSKLFPLHDQGGATKSQINQILAGDSEWLGWMDEAARATRYENYVEKGQQLQQQIWREDRSFSPDVIAQSIQSQAWPDAGNLLAYGDLLIQRAREFHLEGRDAEAERSLQLLADFAERAGTIGRNQRDLNGWILETVRQKSLIELGTLYRSSGKTDRAVVVDVEVANLKKSRMERNSSHGQTFDSLISPFLWKGLFVQLSALAILLFAAISFLSLSSLEIDAVLQSKTVGMWSRIRCFVADYGPLVLLAACASLLLAYRPFEQAFAQFRSGATPVPTQGQMMLLLYSLHFASPTNLGSAFWWWMITLSLSALAMFILFRPLWKRRAAA